MRSRRSVCRLVELSIMHVRGYWRCNPHIERASNLRRFGRRRGASGMVPLFIQSQFRIRRGFEPTTDIGIGNTRLGVTTQTLVSRNCTIIDFSATYSPMQEKIIKNGVEFGHSRLERAWHVGLDPDVGSLFHQSLSNSSVPHPGYSSLSADLFATKSPGTIYTSG